MGSDIRKVPIILQMEALECGAASLGMILAYYKKFIPLEILRVECSVSRDGCNAKNILKSARNNDLVAKGFSCTVDCLKEDDIKFPAIIHWKFNHFVVLCGFKKNKAVIADPADGLTYIPMEEFETSFTGIVLTFEKGEKFEPSGQKKSITRFLVKRLKTELPTLIFIVILGLLLALTNMIETAYEKIFVDNVLYGGSPGIIKPLLIVMAVTAGTMLLIGSLRSIYLLKVKGKMSVDSGAMFMWHVLRLPVNFFAQRFVGDIVQRQNSNDTVAAMICDKIAPIILDVIMVILYLVIILSYDWVMSLIGIAASIMNIIVIKYVSEHNENESKVLIRSSSKVAGIAVAGFSMMETIKASGSEAGYFQKWAGYQTKFSNTMLRIRDKNRYLHQIPRILYQFSNILLQVFGIYRILTGSFTVGTLLAFQGFMSSFLNPFNSIIGVSQNIQEMSGDMEKIEDVLNYPTDVDDSFIWTSELENIDKDYKKLEGNLKIKDLEFAYGPLADSLIKDFSLDIKKGQMIALVGGSGSGKSTIAKIIAGLYDQRSGEVLFDGKKRSEIDRHIFTSSVAMVDQEITLFQDTMENNITMWDTTIDKEFIINACRDACIHEDILERSAGYDHVLTEGGYDFSGGQRQRIEIARAFVGNPTIMILDEATSALDPTTEKLVMDAVRRRGITCIVVAHRLSTIRDANEIIMLDSGYIVERGTHEELLELDGEYAKLIKSE